MTQTRHRQRTSSNKQTSESPPLGGFQGGLLVLPSNTSLRGSSGHNKKKNRSCKQQAQNTPKQQQGAAAANGSIATPTAHINKTESPRKQNKHVAPFNGGHHNSGKQNLSTNTQSHQQSKSASYPATSQQQQRQPCQQQQQRAQSVQQPPSTTRWAGGAYSNAPPAGALPIPTFASGSNSPTRPSSPPSPGGTAPFQPISPMPKTVQVFTLPFGLSSPSSPPPHSYGPPSSSPASFPRQPPNTPGLTDLSASPSRKRSGTYHVQGSASLSSKKLQPRSLTPQIDELAHRGDSQPALLSVPLQAQPYQGGQHFAPAQSSSSPSYGMTIQLMSQDLRKLLNIGDPIVAVA